ncbi:hypothetical protein [Bradyrhizobium sp. Mp27]|uniref:hypothetical protein n=1 Tax=Bradyrhizobium sp. Mp27 TaxID=3042157 RepID=UPI00248AD153|nr:hypothetical protein [Bradyrhizobium sp. Mp27]MDI2074317.1 hypothetical protein [Bradyrhizobium sp. Mp27]
MRSLIAGPSVKVGFEPKAITRASESLLRVNTVEEVGRVSLPADQPDRYKRERDTPHFCGANGSATLLLSVILRTLCVAIFSIYCRLNLMTI